MVLEDRCLLSAANGPYQFPMAVNPPDPNKPYNSVTQMSDVLYSGVSGTYQKTITIYNNSPTQWIYPFLSGELTRQAVSPYQGTSAFDPYDPSTQEYRGYIGYTPDGTTDDAGLPPLTSITITVPLAFWDSARINFSTDGADQFTTVGAPSPPGPVGVPFNFLYTNTQAIYYGSINSSNPNQLNFTPIYNSFSPTSPYMPSTAMWKSPVASGLFTNGESFVVTGPGLPNPETVTVNSSNPGFITLPSPATPTPQTAQQYVFTSLSGQSISQTARYVQTGFTLTTFAQDPPSTTTNGLVMWYHALSAIQPNNDAPDQLTELTFRGAFYDSSMNIGTGFQYLLDPDTYAGSIGNSADYDLSYVDSINMPEAIEATNATIPNTTTQAAYGWVGSDQTIEAFQQALQQFTTTNSASNSNFLGTYFGGQGYPSYLTMPSGQGGVKLPAAQNVFLASPAVPGGVADVQYYKTFSDGSFILQPLYALSTAGAGPSQLGIGGDPAHPSQGHDLGLNTNNMANDYALNSLIAPNVKAKKVYNVTYTPANSNTPISLGTVTGMYYAKDKTTIIGVKISGTVPADAALQSYVFKLSQTDYAAGGIAGLWYTWAKYYADNVKSTAPPNPVMGSITAGNILTLTNAAPGLVPGMTVTTGTGSTGTVPPGCVILSISSDEKTIELSTVASGTSFTFAKPAFASPEIVGFDPVNTPLVKLSFTTAAEKAYALAFAQTVYLCMSAWSVSVPKGTPNAWNPLLEHIIGGLLGPNILPNANTDVMTALTNISKSALRGVPDFTSPLYSNPAQWYPDPALATGGQTFNVYNLNPFVWFIHDKLGLSAYAFSLDDDIGNVGATGATNIDFSVGGLYGLRNPAPYTPQAPFGPVQTQAAATQANSSQIGGLTNQQVLNQIIPFDYAHNTAGTLINGPGVQMGTTVQFTSINPTPSKSTITLSNPLTSSSTSPTFYFFGQLVFTGTVLGKGQDSKTIIFNGPAAQNVYNTLTQLGPLESIQVTGEGIDPTQTNTIAGLNLSVNPITGAITTTVTLLHSLNGKLVSDPGSFYGYTFGSPVVPVIHDPGFEFVSVQNDSGGYNHGSALSKIVPDWIFKDDSTNNWLAGIAFSNTSAYTTGNPLPPQGLQVGFVQGDSSIMTPPVILGPGTYNLTLYTAQSANNQTPQSLKVLVDAIPVGIIQPKGTNYELSTIKFTVKTGGKHVITFQGNQMSGSTVLLDDIVCKPVSAP